ncbi:PTS HPr component phosphorylation site [Caldanaerobius fijiensis DSM 17918]|uniref:PTS HPr component phosphorylation site n=1 Tax=Caldanaerobius fijiensis DSM 17918 TaxID=1121256 RepID=A0A1M5D6U4_9THEO|nr:HPr family phosphocarrier protein [Caldanaerobius fijiensis]SHF62704.1 PTS HPr component phosphorylation site [Caldanaerobius fijiensis DSM 17918]
MKRVNVDLHSIDRVKEFVEITSKYPFELDLISGRYVVDAKSIMGIFSLNLSKPIELVIHSDDEAEVAKFMEEIKEYVVK